MIDTVDMSALPGMFITSVFHPGRRGRPVNQHIVYHVTHGNLNKFPVTLTFNIKKKQIKEIAHEIAMSYKKYGLKKQN
jgi:hypothetical protein